MVGYEPYITAYILALAAILGLVMGSFVNCWAWRFLHGESVAKGRSHCTDCGHVLTARDLVPILSWLLAKGRCRYCDAPVSARYPITEAVCAIAFAAVVARYGLSIETVELLGFCAVLLFLSLTDIDDFLIPNGAILTALAIRVAYLGIACILGIATLEQVGYYLASALGIGAALLAIVLVADRIFGRESMGGGDLKLFAVAALYFGWQRSLFLVIVSCAIGIAVGLFRARSSNGAQEGTEDAAAERGGSRAPRASKPFPFGPSIAVACVITMLFGDQAVSWYLSLL